MKNIHQLIAEAEKLDTPLQETLPVEQASFEVESGQPEEHETEDSVEEMSVPTQSVFTPESAPESPVGSAFTPDDVESPTIDAKTLETQDDPAVVQTREMASYDDFDDLVEGAENSLTDNPEISLETKSFQSQETPASQNEKLLLTRDTSDYGEDSYNENEIHDEPEQPEIDITNDVETPETPETETSTLGEIPDTEQPTIEFRTSSSLSRIKPAFRVSKTLSSRKNNWRIWIPRKAPRIRTPNSGLSSNSESTRTSCSNWLMN